MKIQLSAIKSCITKIIKIYNFIFFIISMSIWLYLTIINIATQPFEISLLWSAFNAMYGQLSFKVGCIFLIVFNGLQSIRSYIFKYYDLMETHENLSTLHKLTKGKKPTK